MNKNNLKYLAILAVLIIIYLITQMSDNTEKRIEFFGVDSADIAVFELSNTEDTLKVKKIEGQWMVIDPLEYEASSNKIDNIFSKVINIETSKMPISENPEKFSKFGVSDSLATRVKFYDNSNKLLCDAVVGKSENNYQYSYGRMQDGQKVYQLLSNISYYIKPKPSDWRDKQFAGFTKEEIDKIEVKSKDYDYTLTFKDTAWVYTGNDGSLDLKKENRVLKNIKNSLATMRANDFIDNDFAAYSDKFDNPYMMVKVDLYDGQSINFKFAEHDEDKKYLVQKNENQKTLYVVREYSLKRIQKKLKDFEK